MLTARQHLEVIIKEVDKVAIIIDGHTTHSATKSINMKIDWSRFQSFFTEIARVRTINYYMTVTKLEVGNNEYDIDIDTIKLTGEDKPWWYNVINWMSYNNYKVTLKRGRDISYGDTSSIGIKSSIDVSIALDCMNLHDIDHVIFLTGNTEHADIIKALQAKGIIVTVIGNSNRRIRQELEDRALGDDKQQYPFTVSKRLIKASNYFIDFLDLIPFIGPKDK